MVEDSIGTIVEWAFEDGPNLQEAPAGFAPVIMATCMIVHGGKDERNHLYFNRLSSKLSGTALIDYYRLKFILRRFSVFVNRSQNYQNQIIYF